jgi:hypothetical protein
MMNTETLFSTRLLEAITGNQFIVGIGMVGFFVWFILRTFKWRRGLSFSTFFTSPSLKLGWSLTVYAAGDGINRGMVWFTRHAENNHGATVSSSTYTVVMVFAMLVNIWGGLCALRAASPASAGEKPWLAVLVMATVLGFGVAFLL